MTSSTFANSRILSCLTAKKTYSIGSEDIQRHEANTERDIQDLTEEASDEDFCPSASNRV